MLNKVILMGRLTADPELRQTTSGVSTCRITVACDRNFTPQGQEKQADFITVVAWRQTAEFISKYFNKGKMIVVEGTLRTSTYDDKRYPDVRHYVTEVLAEQVNFAGDKNTDGNQGGYESAPFQYQKPQYNNNQSQPQQQYAPQQNSAPSISVGDLGDFEEVIGDSELPF